MTIQATSAQSAGTQEGSKLETRGVLILVVAIFFLFGGITNLNAIGIMHAKLVWDVPNEELRIIGQ